MNKPPILYMLIGIPGSGKSTWINDFVIANGFKPDSYLVLSTDNYIEVAAEQCSKTYSECFKDYIEKAEHALQDDLNEAIFSNLDIIWDQTNTTVKSRKKKLAHPGLARYLKVAIYFDTPYETCLERIKQRPGKEIPIHIMESMRNSLAIPSRDEGFQSIICI